MRYILFIAAFLTTGIALQCNSFLPRFKVADLLAVKPASLETRKKAEASRQKEIKEKAKEQRASGCKYGRDKVTGKCYEPKEGQFYRDPNTGDVKRKETECYNLPWKPCK